MSGFERDAPERQAQKQQPGEMAIFHDRSVVIT
jgi:hypothetical protein